MKEARVIGLASGRTSGVTPAWASAILVDELDTGRLGRLFTCVSGCVRAALSRAGPASRS
jgi:hypothetical protein